jgi:hypothetical protein
MQIRAQSVPKRLRRDPVNHVSRLAEPVERSHSTPHPDNAHQLTSNVWGVDDAEGREQESRTRQVRLIAVFASRLHGKGRPQWSLTREAACQRRV